TMSSSASASADTGPTPVANSDRGPTHVLVQADPIAPPDRARLTSAFPTVHFTFAVTKEEVLAAAPTAEVLFGKGISREILDAAVALRWVQAGTAGVDGLIRAGIAALAAERCVVLTNARGAHGAPISENILTMALCFATRMHVMLRAAPSRQKPHRRVLQEKWELEGQTMLVVGLGDIGGTLAVKAKGLGLYVIGVRRSGRPADGCDEVHTPDQLPLLLPRADHVALCLPLTEETDSILGERELRLMKPSAYVYNVGRGASIDGAALRRALREKWIAGAGLDCVAPSDVPADDDPLWELEDVILSMHTSGHSPYNSGRITDIFAANLRRYLAGEPLQNVVNPARGY
ncbi:MAG TPA: D-2-hydroxyacid dehydrogenase, partial [Chloroflexota bacterium]|nr:D-2-hydroxyacid dehydrogenase [Chloroflexota bacterium]